MQRNDLLRPRHPYLRTPVWVFLKADLSAVHGWSTAEPLLNLACTAALSNSVLVSSSGQLISVDPV